MSKAIMGGAVEHVASTKPPLKRNRIPVWRGYTTKIDHCIDFQNVF